MCHWETRSPETRAHDVAYDEMTDGKVGDEGERLPNKVSQHLLVCDRQ
jgi:hypothetical protein